VALITGSHTPLLERGFGDTLFVLNREEIKIKDVCTKVEFVQTDVYAPVTNVFRAHPS